MKIWLADLTHTHQTVASDVMPAGVAGIGEYLAREWPGLTDLRIFKFPEALSAAFAEDQPDVLGVSNYVWNANLGHAFLRRAKELRPDIVTVMGGPNFPTDAEEQRQALEQTPWLDFHVMKEGEAAFLELVGALAEHGRDAIKATRHDIANTLYLDADGRLVQPTRIERIVDLDAIPSPYLTGRLAPFFDGRLLPVIQTNRGCPFSCSFCTEGQAYWTKVRPKSAELIHREIAYIAEKMAELPQHERRRDLLIADSNFGMFNEDLDTCRVLRDVQDQYGYPQYINVATGKNKKERVLEAAKLVRGAMKLSGSVQSTDAEVLKNIKRSNISTEQILELAMKAAEIGANTYSEVILGLPGDTVETHFSTLKTLVDAGFNTLSMYQLMVLPGTELGAATTKAAYGMVCRYRAIPRCFGTYDIFGRPTPVAEIEEICVQTNSLSYEDYLACRKMNLIVNIFYNDGVFSEINKVLRGRGLSVWQWMLAVNTSRHAGFNDLIGDFLADTRNELHESRAALEAETADPANIQDYVEGRRGSNLMFKYKALSLTRFFEQVCGAVAETVAAYLAANGVVDEAIDTLIAEIIAYKRLQVEGIFLFEDKPHSYVFQYDIAALSAVEDVRDIARFRFAQPTRLDFYHTPEQSQSIASYLNIFGGDVIGLTRILSRVFLKQFFRQPRPLDLSVGASAKAS